jgi:hypothetical protein
VPVLLRVLVADGGSSVNDGLTALLSDFEGLSGPLQGLLAALVAATGVAEVAGAPGGWRAARAEALR